MEEKRYLQTELTEIEGEKLFVASNSTYDRQGESIEVDGWDIENYKKNPVILWGHDHSIPAIGKAEKIGYKTINGKKSLVFQPVFHKKSELSKLVADLVEEGWIRATSVGFIGKEWDGERCLKQELLENSIVNVGANQEALNLAFAKGYSKDVIKTVMPEAIYEKQINELNEKVSSLEEQIKSLSEVKPQSGDLGREPVRSKKEIDRRTALKALNRVIEELNKQF
jgi:polyhydroxyalkanoate synthesis regulator phasin